MRIADVVSLRSTCTSETCLRKNLRPGEQPELCRGVHAEINCIIQAAIHGTSIKGETTLYSTTFPCMSCLKLIINAGISRLVYIKEMVNESKLEIVKLC